MSFKNETRDMYSETTWWQRRSKLEKILLALSGLAVVVILSLIVALKSGSDDTRCSSKECIHLSNTLLEAMNTNLNPCDDFHDYVCSGVKPNLTLSISPENHNIIVNERFKRILEQPVLPNEPGHLLSLKTLYRSCTNQSSYEMKNLNRLKGILTDLGGWPLLEGSRWSNLTFDWKYAVQKLRKIGYNLESLVPITVGDDVRDGKGNIVYLDFPRLKYYEYKLKPQYFNYMVDMSVMVGLHTYVGRTELREVYDFEMELLKIYPSEKYIARDYTKYNLNELQQRFPSIPWYEYINGLLYPIAKLNYGEDVIVINSNYLKRVISLLMKTPSRTIANFIGWSVVHHLGKFVNKQAYMIMTRHGVWQDDESPTNKEQYIWEHCVDVVRSRLGLLLLPEYVKLHGEEFHRARGYLQDLSEVLREQFKETISRVSWLDAAARAFSLEKLAQMRIHISAARAVDNQLLGDIYEPVEIQDNKYLASILNVDFANVNLEYGKLRKESSGTYSEDVETATNTLVEYSAETNTLVVSALHFHSVQEDYVNFGGAGAIIAREMAKVITDGQFFGLDGVFRGWNSRQHLEAFTKSEDCLRKLYRNDGVKPNLQIDVEEPEYPVLEELYGIQAAYNAYDAWSVLRGADKALSGLDLAPNQMFWVVYAFGVCSREQRDTVFVKMGRKNLINQPLKHLAEFSQGFHCRKEEKMNSRLCDL